MDTKYQTGDIVFIRDDLNTSTVYSMDEDWIDICVVDEMTAMCGQSVMIDSVNSYRVNNEIHYYYYVRREDGKKVNYAWTDKMFSDCYSLPEPEPLDDLYDWL